MDAVAIRQSRPRGGPSKEETFRSGYNSVTEPSSAISRSEFLIHLISQRCRPYWKQQRPEPQRKIAIFRKKKKTAERTAVAAVELAAVFEQLRGCNYFCRLMRTALNRVNYCAVGSFK